MSLIDHIAIKGSISSNSPSLADELTTSPSDLNLDDVSPNILSTERIEQLFPNYNTFGYPEWVSQSYSVGDRVVFERVAYLCEVANSDSEFTPANWESVFSNELRKVKKIAYNNFKSDLTVLRSNIYQVSKIKKGSFLFSANTKAVTNQKQGKFNCIQLRSNTQDIIEVDKVGAIVTEPQTLTYYLYHSDSFEALETRQITFTSSDVSKGFAWKAIDSIKIQDAGINNTGGAYYFGFFESDLQGDLMTWNYTWNYGSATNINAHSYNLWSAYYGCYGVYPITLEPNGVNLPVIGEYFDRYGYDGEIAFNLGIKVYEDFDYILDDHADVFEIAFQYRFALDVAKKMRSSNRKNEDVSMTDIDNFIYGVKDITAGTEGKFKELSKRGVESEYKEKLQAALQEMIKLLPDQRGLVS